MISYIIPVYNTEPRKLLRCLSSIKNNAVNDYEVIIVDDGSVNKDTIQCYVNYCSSNPNFKYYQFDNAGVSAARNKGIELASGDYVFFVDSDDELLCDIAVNCEFDIYLTSLKVNDNSPIRVNESNCECSIKDYMVKMINNGYIGGPYAKYIRTAFLKNNKILFRDWMNSGEDIVFNLDILKNKPRIQYVDVCTYRYYIDLQTWINRYIKDPQKTIKSYFEVHKSYRILLQSEFTSITDTADLVKQVDVDFTKKLLRAAVSVKGINNVDGYAILREEISKLFNSELCDDMNLFCKLALSSIKVNSIIIYKAWLAFFKVLNIGI